MIVSKMP